KQLPLTFHAGLILVESRVHELHVSHAVRYEIDLLGRNAIDFLQQLSPTFSHHDKTIRQRIELLHDESLRLVRFTQHSVERRHHGHMQIAQQSKQMTSGRPAVYAKLVLD